MIKVSWKTFGRALASLLCMSAVAFPCRADVRYGVTGLGTLGGTFSGATAINANGVVVGYADTSDGQRHAFVYDHGAKTDLGTIGTGTVSYATGINDQGDIVGYSSTSGSINHHAFVVHNGTLMDLNATIGGSTSEAYGINASGQIVGTAFLPNSLGTSNADRAFLLDGATTTVLTGIDPALFPYAARGINDSGQIAGTFYPVLPNGDRGDGYHAYLATSTSITNLDAPTATLNSVATAISSTGEVVGYTVDGTGTQQTAVLWTAGGITPISTNNSQSLGINSANQVVGMMVLPGGVHHGFFHDSSGLIDLNDLIDPRSGWTITSATGINDLGQIVGVGIDSSGSVQAVLLNPLGVSVPEPSSLLLMALGGGVLMAVGRRRSRQFLASDATAPSTPARLTRSQ